MKITSKAEATARIRNQYAEQLEQLTARIEDALAKYNGSTVSVVPSGIAALNDEIAERYRREGWTVEFGVDRDGGWMTLS